MLFLLFQVYADPEVDKEIMASIVRCSHHMDGCRWVDKLQHLQVHTSFKSL